MPGAFLSICRALLPQIDYHIDMTDAIFLPLTRAWGGEGYDEAVGGGQVVTRAGRARINDFLFLKFPKSVYFIKFCVHKALKSYSGIANPQKTGKSCKIGIEA